jgi:hypothetical protein
MGEWTAAARLEPDEIDEFEIEFQPRRQNRRSPMRRRRGGHAPGPAGRTGR